MGYSRQKSSAQKTQRKLDNALTAVFADGQNNGKAMELSEAAHYLAGLYLYAHGDERFGDVLDSLKVETTYGTTADGFTESNEYACASSTVPRFFNDYLMIRSNELSHGLEIESDGNVVMVSVRVWSRFYPYADLLNKADAVKIACFAIFQGLSMVVEPVARYQMNQRSMEWEHCDNRAPIILVMDAIVEGRVTACPVCGKPVYLKNRKNASPFCKPAHNTTYERRARRYLENGASVDEVKGAFPHVDKETIRTWLKDLEVEQ